MEYDAQLKLQAYLDGELSDKEAREVANWLAQDREAVALHSELRNTRQAMAGLEVGVELPESREFYWSKIAREIRQLEGAEPARERPPLFALWRRLLLPATAIASLLLIGLLAGIQLNRTPASQALETASADSGAFTYRDYASGTTLVWLSYPAEKELASGTPAATVE